MSERRNALLLFSKLPEPGLVKTRLTTLKDGMFDPETASALYHRMLFDVVEIVCCAFDRLETEGSSHDVNDAYELVISTAPVENVSRMEALFAEAGTWPRPIMFIGDTGATFDEHYNDAFRQIWERGADCILSMGADMPALTVDDVVDGFRALHKLEEEVDDKSDASVGGIVLAPDQEMGVSVIGWTRETDFDHTGVFYNQEGLTVLPAYVRKAAAAGLSAVYLRPVPDVDTMNDLVHTATLLEATNYCAPFDGNCPGYRTWEMLVDLGLNEVRIPPNALHDPREHIDR